MSLNKSLWEKSIGLGIRISQASLTKFLRFMGVTMLLLVLLGLFDCFRSIGEVIDYKP